MKKEIVNWQLIGFASTSLAGTILHFLYEWLGKPIWIAPFSGINESTWEHMKLLFWPMFIFAVIQSFFFKDSKSFWHIKMQGILLGLSLIPIIYYTVNGAFGKTPDWFNISIFFISAALAYLYESYLFIINKKFSISKYLPISVLVLISISFVIFTFFTPRINLFTDPITGKYGIYY